MRLWAKPIWLLVFDSKEEREVSFMKTIAFSSMKGGVGKSTASIFVANNLAARGFKVLFFDLDTNNSGSMYYTIGIDNIQELQQTKNTFEALSHNNIADCIIKSRIENIDIVPSSLYIYKLRTIGFNNLKKELEKIKDNYDFCLIDTAPTWDNIVINAYKAATFILTPIQLDFFNTSTTEVLKSFFYDEVEEVLENNKWFLFYSEYNPTMARYPQSTQSQFEKYFESHWENILDIHIPKTAKVSTYVCKLNEHVSTKSSVKIEKMLADEINKLVNMLTGEENNIEKF